MLRTLFRFSLLLTLTTASALQAEDAWHPTEGWYTLHHDVMRSGRTQDSPGVPFDYVWHKEYWDELIATEVEPIVAESLVFFGTLKGIVQALDADGGREKWRADLGSPVHHSPAYDGGRLFVATMSPRGEVAAFEAVSGRELWRFKPQRRGGFAASPAVYGGHVFLGDRAGDFYALDAASGRAKWRVSLGAPILQSAAVRDGKVAIAAEDLVPRLLCAADGKELWKGRQITGATVRGYYPVFWKDLIVWRTETYGIEVYQNNILEATEDGRLYAQTRRQHGWSQQAEDIIRTLPGRYTEEKYRQEQQYIQEQMKAGKHPRSFYALKVSDGSEPVIHAVGYHANDLPGNVGCVYGGAGRRPAGLSLLVIEDARLPGPDASSFGRRHGGGTSPGTRHGSRGAPRRAVAAAVQRLLGRAGRWRCAGRVVFQPARRVPVGPVAGGALPGAPAAGKDAGLPAAVAQDLRASETGLPDNQGGQAA